MEVVVLQVFVSLILVVGSILLFGVSSRLREYEHSDRLALMPLDEQNVHSSTEIVSNENSTSDLNKNI